MINIYIYFQIDYNVLSQTPRILETVAEILNAVQNTLAKYWARDPGNEVSKINLLTTK